MKRHQRRVIQAILYESIAIILITPIFSLLFDKELLMLFTLSLFLAFIAVTWSYVFNWIFEQWESRQARKERTLSHRVMHSLGFEGGLTIIIVPIMARVLDTSLFNAFLAELGVLVFFFFYSLVFTWVFDKTFGLPEIAKI